MSRFQKYLDKFKSTENPEVKKTLGDFLAEQLGIDAEERVKQILPFYTKGGGCATRTVSFSFWDRPRKQIVVTTILDFDENVVWKDEEELSKQYGSGIEYKPKNE